MSLNESNVNLVTLFRKPISFATVFTVGPLKGFQYWGPESAFSPWMLAFSNVIYFPVKTHLIVVLKENNQNSKSLGLASTYVTTPVIY